MGRIRPWEEARFGVGCLSAFANSDGLDSDVERIIDKGSLQEVKSGAMVPVEIFHAENE